MAYGLWFKHMKFTGVAHKAVVGSIVSLHMQVHLLVICAGYEQKMQNG